VTDHAGVSPRDKARDEPRGLATAAGFAVRRHVRKHRHGQQSEDRNDDEQLDEGKAAYAMFAEDKHEEL
jgi:hypothetical protein